MDTQGAMGLVNDPEVLVIDTRDEPDFRKQHIPGAVSLPYHEFNQRYPHFAESVSEARPLLLYCYGTGCGLAARVGKRLITRGYTDVTILRGGIEAWKAGNLPLETPEERNENQAWTNIVAQHLVRPGHQSAFTYNTSDGAWARLYLCKCRQSCSPRPVCGDHAGLRNSAERGSQSCVTMAGLA